MMLCQLWTLYTTELQHRQMFMNGFEARLWELVIACLKVYIANSYRLMNATGNLNLQTSSLSKICSGCLLFTALLLNPTAVGPLSSTPFPIIVLLPVYALPWWLLLLHICWWWGWRQAGTGSPPSISSVMFHCKWLLFSESSHYKMHVPCFNMRHCDVLMTIHQFCC